MWMGWAHQPVRQERRLYDLVARPGWPLHALRADRDTRKALSDTPCPPLHHPSHALRLQLLPARQSTPGAPALRLPPAFQSLNGTLLSEGNVAADHTRLFIERIERLEAGEKGHCG